MNQKFLTECPMCYELYDENQRIPRNLLCGHTYCEYCLIRIYQDKQQIVCPTCRTQHDNTMKPNLLSKNYIAQDLAQKEAQSKNKYEYCEKHQEPIQFYCENDKENLCSDCIVEHPGHKFLKIKYSIPLLKTQLDELAQELSQKIENSDKQKEDLENVQKQVVKGLKKSQDQVEEEFEKIYKVLDDKKNKILQDIEDYYTKQQEDINFEIVLQESISTEQNNQLHKLDKIQQELRKQDYLKDGELANKLKEVQQTIYKQDKELEDKQQNSVSINQPPQIDISIQGVFNEIQQLGKFKKVINGKICYMGEKNKILMYDIEKKEWFLKNLKNSPYFEFYYYSSAVTLPCGDLFVSGGGVSSKAYQISINKNFLTQQKSPMSEPRKEHASIIIGKQVYVFGGYNNKEKKMLNSCEVYDIEFDMWKPLPYMNSAKCAIAIAQLNDEYIYIIGGFDGKTRLKSIERYDLLKQEWEVLDVELEHALSNAAAYGINSKEILIIGGGNDDGFSEQTIIFNTQTNQLTQITPMGEGRDLRNKLVKYNGELYAIGGHNKSGSKFNILKQNWSTIPQYGNLLQDHLDSWSCAICYEFEGEDEQLEESQLEYQNINDDIYQQQQQQQQHQQHDQLQQLNNILNGNNSNRFNQQLNDNAIMNNTNPIIQYNNPNPYGFLYQPGQSRGSSRNNNINNNNNLNRVNSNNNLNGNNGNIQIGGVQYAYNGELDDSDNEL